MVDQSANPPTEKSLKDKKRHLSGESRESRESEGLWRAHDHHDYHISIYVFVHFISGNSLLRVLDGQQFAVNSKETMNTFIKRIVGNPDIRITESSLDEAESSIGKFNLIRAKYEQEDLV